LAVNIESLGWFKKEEWGFVDKFIVLRLLSEL